MGHEGVWNSPRIVSIRRPTLAPARQPRAGAFICSRPAAAFAPRPCTEFKEMAVPRKKVSPMKRGQRRSHDALSAPTYIEDKESGERRRPHHIDLKTGKYRGRQILEPKADV